MVKQAVILAAGEGTRLAKYVRELPKPLVKVAGVPLIKRTILSAQKGEIDEFVIVIGYKGESIKTQLESDKMLEGVKIAFVYNEDWEKSNGLSLLKARDFVAGNFLLLMADHIFEPSILRSLQCYDLKAKECALCVDKGTELIYDLDDATKVKLKGDKILDIGKKLKEYDAVDMGIFLCSPHIFEALEQSMHNGDCSISDGVRILAEEGNMTAFDMSGAMWQDVDTPGALKEAEKRLLKSACKSEDGFIARHLNRRISLFLSRLLAKTSATPNQITLVHLFLGILSACLIAFEGYWPLLFAGILFQLASIIDGCDGELARLKFLGSKLGEWLDTISDEVVYSAFLVGVSLRMYAQAGKEYILIIGGFTVVAVIISCVLICTHLKRYTNSGRLATYFSIISAAIPKDNKNVIHKGFLCIKLIFRQDFIALLFLVLAALNLSEGIFWLNVFGGSLFWFSTIYFRRYVYR
jgi:CDP-L-myo-inositol myo-inositolphosphotransferase